MPSTDFLARLGLTLSVLAATGCTTAPEPSPTHIVSAAPGTIDATPVDTNEPIESPSALPSMPAIDLPQPGRPFDATTLLAAMRDSRRPGGVPDQIETDAVAAALADAIWTLDGQPWTTMAAGGSCGPDSCTLEVAGSRSDTPGEDLWVFGVAPATGSVQVVSSELRSLHDDVAAQLDELTRTIIRTGNLDGVRLTSVRWLPPPEEDQFVLSYRSGGQFGACGIDYTLDAVDAAILSVQAVSC